MQKQNFIFYILVLIVFQIVECESMTNNNENYIHSNKENQKNYFQINDDYEIMNLKDEMNRNEISLDNKAYKFINDNSDLIYIFETNSRINIKNKDSNAFIELNILEYGEDNYLIMSSQSNENVKITSIPNSNVYIEQLFGENFDELLLKQKFTNIKIIQTNTNNLISSFDSFDENNDIYYANYSVDNFNPKDIHPINVNSFTKIDKKKDLITLDMKSTYIIINKVYEQYLSSFEYFIAPEINNNNEINLVKDSEKYIYLNTNKEYKINTKDIKNPRLIKLSDKTKNSVITINDDKIDKDNIFYELKKDEEYVVKVRDENALIEFLYDIKEDGKEIFDDIETLNTTINGNSILLKFDTLHDYVIKLTSDLNKSFGASICYKFGKGNYHYYSEECKEVLTFGFSYEDTIKKEKFNNITLRKDELYMAYINIYRNNTPIYLSYYPTNFDESWLNSANFSNTELEPNNKFKYIIQGKDKYILDLNIDKDEIKSYSPIFTLVNRTFHNETHLEIKNEDDSKNFTVYINYHKNWPQDKDITIRIISNHAENILLGIYIAGGILMVACFVIAIIAIAIMIRKRRESSENNESELLNN